MQHICKFCNIPKDISLFWIQKGIPYKCKECRNNKIKEKRRELHPERFITSSTKYCKDCNETKELCEFRVKKDKYTYYCHICIECEHKRNIITTRNWRKNISQEQREKQYKQRRDGKYDVKYRKELTDCYIRGILMGKHSIPKNNISFELIETKRTQIKLIRLCQNKQTK